MSGSIGSGTSAVRAEDDTEAYFCFERASAICCLRCFFSAFSRDAFARRFDAALSWFRSGCFIDMGPSPVFVPLS
jgi:hypothetical protein